MVSDLSSLVELFAAVYITMAVNNDFCSNFWTPQYYKDMDALLKQYGFLLSTPMSEKLSMAIKSNYESVQQAAHRRGTLMFLLCVCTLVFMGFEDESKGCGVVFYAPLLYAYLLTVAFLAFSQFLLSSWRGVFATALLYFVIFFACTHCARMADNVFIQVVCKYCKSIVVLVVVIPVFYQLYVNWIYSSVYKGYLKNKVGIEHKRYSDSIEGIKNKKKEKVDKVYLEKWTDVMFSSSGDDTITGFSTVLFDKLLKAATPSQFCLIKSWLKHKLKAVNCDKTASIQKTTPQTVQEIACIDSNSPLAKFRQTGEYSRKYEDFLVWQRKTHRPLDVYCRIKNIKYDEMQAWVVANRPHCRV